MRPRQRFRRAHLSFLRFFVTETVSAGYYYMVNGTRTRINADIILNEPHGGIRFGTDALLLSWAAYAAAAGKKRVLDIGTGSGVIPLLLLGAGSRSHFTGLEIQPEYASAANENAAQNGFSARFTAICGSAGDAAALFPAGGFDVVVTNPPYMRADCGYVNTSHALSVARREESGGIAMFCAAAAHCLKSGGKFFAVYRPDRLSHLFCSMSENGIEPKRLRFVVPSVGKKPSLVLVQGCRGGREGMVCEPDLYIYNDPAHSAETKEMLSVYERFSGERNG